MGIEDKSKKGKPQVNQMASLLGLFREGEPTILLNSLPPGQRRIVESLIGQKHPSQKTTAQQLGLDPTTVSTAVRRAVAILRRFGDTNPPTPTFRSPLEFTRLFADPEKRERLLSGLSDEDRTLVEAVLGGLSRQDIVKHFGYSSVGAVSERIKKIDQQLRSPGEKPPPKIGRRPNKPKPKQNQLDKAPIIETTEVTKITNETPSPPNLTNHINTLFAQARTATESFVAEHRRLPRQDELYDALVPKDSKQEELTQAVLGIWISGFRIVILNEAEPDTLMLSQITDGQIGLKTLLTSSPTENYSPLAKEEIIILWMFYELKMSINNISEYFNAESTNIRESFGVALYKLKKLYRLSTLPQGDIFP